MEDANYSIIHDENDYLQALKSPVRESDVVKIAAFTRAENATVIRKVVSILSLESLIETICKPANYSLARHSSPDGPRVFVANLHLLLYLCQIPEFSSVLVKRVGFWNLVLLRFEYMGTYGSSLDLDVARLWIAICGHLLVSIKKSHKSYIVKSRVVRSAIVVLSQASIIANEEVMSMHFTALIGSSITLFGLEGVMDFFEKNWVIENKHFLPRDIRSMVENPEFYIRFVESDDYLSVNRSFLKQSLPKIQCNACGKMESERKHKKCGRCESVFYCNESCQKAHWKKHKKCCKKLTDRSRPDLPPTMLLRSTYC